MSTEEKKAIIRQFVHAFNCRDMEAVYAVFAPTCTFPTLLGFPPTLQGCRQLVLFYIESFPDVQYTIEELIAEGDTVVARVTEHGTHMGTWRGIPATKKRFQFQAICLYRLSNGKIVEWSYYSDQWSLLQQLGLTRSFNEKQ